MTIPVRCLLLFSTLMSTIPHRNLIIACLMTATVAACHTQRPAIGTIVQHDGEPQYYMTCISGRLYYDSLSDTHRIRVDEVLHLDGRVKMLRQYTQQEMDESFSFVTMRADGQTIQRYGMDNPLTTTFEYVADDGTLSKMTQRSDSAEFFIRVPLDDKPDNVQIRFKNNTLVTIPLKR